MAGHQRTADSPAGGGRADGRTPRRAADRGGDVLRMGIHAYAMGEGRARREPQSGGREDVPTEAVVHLQSEMPGMTSRAVLAF